MINDEQLEKVRIALETGMPLNFTMLGRIFGEEFWQLIIIALTNMTIKADYEKIQINITS